jgi:hypothetical protein
LSVPGVQVPPWQLSIVVHGLLALQGVPFETGVCTQPMAGSHEAAMQTLLLVHVMGVFVQTPPTHIALEWHMSLIPRQEVLSAVF